MISKPSNIQSLVTPISRILLLCLFSLFLATPAVNVPCHAQVGEAEQRSERDRLSAAADEARLKGDWKKELELVHQMLAVEESWLGRQHEDTMGSCIWLAGLYEQMMDWPQAKQFREAALSIAVGVHGKDDWHTTDARLALANVGILSRLTKNQPKPTTVQIDELKRASILVSDAISEFGDYKLAMAQKSIVAASEIRKRILGDTHPDYASTLYILARIYSEMENYQGAEQLYSHCQKIRRQVLGERHPESIAIIHELASFYNSIGDFPRSKSLYEQCRDLRKQVLGEEHPEYLTTLNNLSSLYQSMGEYALAEPVYLQCSEIQEKILGKDDPRYAITLGNLAGLYKAMGAYQDAEEWYLKSEKIQKAVLGESHPSYAITIQNMAGLYHKMGDDSRAESMYRQVLNIERKVLGEEHTGYATTLNNLAGLYESMGDYTRAEPLYSQCLAIFKAAVGESHPAYATVTNNLASLYQSMGDHARAESLFRQCLEIERRLLGEEHPSYARTLNNLATLNFAMGYYARAEPLWLKCLDITKAVLGEEHPAYATMLGNLATLSRAMGDFGRAESWYLQCLQTRRKLLGNEHPAYASSLNNLALFYHATGDYKKSEDLLLQCLKIQKKILGQEHPVYAGTLINLASCYDLLGEYSRAEPLYLQCMKIQKETVGTQHPAFASALHNLALSYSQKGDYAKAEPLYLQSLGIRGKILGKNHPDYANGLHQLAVLCRSMGDRPRAAELMVSSLDHTVRHLDETSLVLSERQQLDMNQMLRHQLDSYLSLALDTGQDIRVDAARAAMKWKGATLVRQRSMRLASRDPNIAQRFKQLQQVARQLASLSRAKHTADNAGWEQQINSLTIEKEKLEAELSRSSAAFRSTLKTVSSKMIQASIPREGILIDFLEFRRSKPAREKGQWEAVPSLLAIVATRDGDPQLFEMGPIKPVSEAIDTWRRSYGTSPEGKLAAKALRKLLWAPLLEQISGAETILVSTDGALGRFPFGVLPGKQPNTYLIEDHRLAMVPVPLLLPALVNNQTSQKATHELLLMGGVDYDADLRHKEPSQNDASAAMPVNRTFAFLEGASGEISAIKDVYRDHGDFESSSVLTLEGSMATESRFREQAPQFLNLHLATHGFFAPTSQVSAMSSRSVQRSHMQGRLASDDQRVIGFNPGLLSGLVFAGANRESKSGEDDGILTSQEISFMPLEGVETVVLSACETGLGEVAGGEGLIGIQRAFQVAGVRSTVASLWKVDDDVTRVLMISFYRNLRVKGLSRLDALREAQLEFSATPVDFRPSERIETRFSTTFRNKRTPPLTTGAPSNCPAIGGSN